MHDGQHEGLHLALYLGAITQCEYRRVVAAQLFIHHNAAIDGETSIFCELGTWSQADGRDDKVGIQRVAIGKGKCVARSGLIHALHGCAEVPCHAELRQRLQQLLTCLLWHQAG